MSLYGQQSSQLGTNVYNQDESEGYSSAEQPVYKSNDIEVLPCICGFLTMVIIVLIFLVAVKSTTNRSRLQTKKEQIMYFHRPGCPHCVKFNPIWNEFVTKANLDPNLKNNFQFRKIDCTDSNLSALCVKERDYGLKGVPHIVWIKSDGSRLVFRDGRSVDNLLTFVYGPK